MKRFLPRKPRGRSRRGFSLVEAVLSLGIMSFGFLALAPLLALGLSGAHQARENRTSSQIAATLIEQGKQGTLVAGPLYFDSASNPSPASGAAYVVQESTSDFSPGTTASGPLTRLTLRVVPVGSPATGRTYADVFPTPPAP